MLLARLSFFLTPLAFGIPRCLLTFAGTALPGAPPFPLGVDGVNERELGGGGCLAPQTQLKEAE